MTREQAINKATEVINRANAYFKEHKNFGALTTLKRKETFTAKLVWLKDYCNKKQIEFDMFFA